LAGPVVAAAVALKTFRFKNRIDDSKKLTPLSREKAFQEISEKADFAVGIIDEKVIDRVNILVATRMAMQEAVEKLVERIENFTDFKAHILVDGNMRLDFSLPYLSIIAGDAKSQSIAAASIMAKVTRDRIMDGYDRIYPQYGFIRHKGYPTSMHRMALKKFGPSDIHRRSFYGV